MNKNIQFLAITLFLFSNALAEGKGNGFGFTIKDINTGSMNTEMLPSIYYVINIASGGRIEPNVGFLSLSNDYNESTLLTFGIGYLKNKTQSDNYSTYWGGRFSMSSNSDSDTNLITIAPICGAEYSFSDHVSIGGETRFNILMFDETMQNVITPYLFFRFYK